MSKKTPSTYERLMESMSPDERKEYDEELRQLLLSELLIAIMEADNIFCKKVNKNGWVISNCRSSYANR